ncbi:MAG TPA: tyrosine-type recombinase/integrase [Blastocatellia bacterium]
MGTNGKKKQIAKLVGSKSDVSQKAIRKALRDLENDIEEKGIQAYENKDTLDEWLDKWLMIVKPTVKERTYIDYKNVCRLYVRPTLGRKRIKDVDVTQVELLVSQLQAKGLRSRPVRYACTVLGMALKHAKRRKLIPVNPVEDVSNLPKKDTREMTALTAEQGVIFLAGAKEVSHWLIFKFALMTGMRPEEYLGLQWRDLNLTAATVTIQRTVYWPRYVDDKSEMFEKRGKWRFESTKTEKSRRTLDLPEVLVKDLARHRKDQMEYRLKKGDKYENFDLVFASEVGTPISCRNLSRALKSILNKTQLPNIRLYDLRHSFATLLLGAGENIKVISALLGHADETETMRTYLHVTPTMKRKSTEMLAKILEK